MKMKDTSKKVTSSLTQLHTKGLSYAGRAIVRAYTRVVDGFLKASKRFQKADIIIAEKKKGSLYEAGVFIKQLGKKGFAFHVERRNLRDLLHDVTKKIRRITRSK